MLWTIGVVLVVLWLLGLFSGYTLGGVIHILLVIALIVVVVQVIQGPGTGNDDPGSAVDSATNKQKE